MNFIQKIGIGLLIFAILIFTLSLGMSDYTLQPDKLKLGNVHHETEILRLAESEQMLNKTYTSNIAFIRDFNALLLKAQNSLNQKAQNGIPAGVNEWDYKIGDWKIKDYVQATVRSSAAGFLPSNRGLMFFMTFGIGILGGLIFILPKFNLFPGIKHDGIYHNTMTRGLKLTWRGAILCLSTLGILCYGSTYMGGQYFWPLLSFLVMLIITYFVFIREGQGQLNPPKSASPISTAWLGLIFGSYLIVFYVLLYWYPEYLNNWVLIVDPISQALSGNPASQWFLYGFLYTIIVCVMGIRMIAKYMHNRYQIIRTLSVMFFQTAFAFLIPEILVRLNQPWFDFKNIWPLNYTFFFDWNIDQLIQSGGLGIFMLVWGTALTIIGVPLITYFYGKRWYCSWVCGCGGLAETLGDPYRQLSDKSLRAWKYERYIIHGVLVFAIVMTGLVLYSYFAQEKIVLGLNSDVVRTWYGFFIGSAFAGVVGTGFYPLMGNRVWCRFGCPLAAYLGLVQRFKSRFRITTNGGQCISCGNCSTYCEMGIDVRWYAQRGQDIIRSSCVGCGVCSAVCPRGVLRLENGSSDITSRASELRAIHITEDQVKLLQ